MDAERPAMFSTNSLKDSGVDTANLEADALRARPSSSNATGKPS
jgi:hypothetical protein